MNVDSAPRRHEHVVQFFGHDSARLERNVARFLNESLRAGGAAVIVSVDERRPTLAAQLGSDRVLSFDARETLAQLTGNDGRPIAGRFQTMVVDQVRALLAEYGRLSIYGEMVGLLWSARLFAAALELEGLWNELRDSLELDLFCGYPIDVMGEEFQLGCVRPVLAAHTRVVPAVGHGFELALRRAMDEVLGAGDHGLRPLTAQRFAAMDTSMPPVEQTLLRLRSTLPRYADEILALAQEYYRA